MTRTPDAHRPHRSRHATTCINSHVRTPSRTVHARLPRRGIYIHLHRAFSPVTTWRLFVTRDFPKRLPQLRDTPVGAPAGHWFTTRQLPGTPRCRCHGPGRAYRLFCLDALPSIMPRTTPSERHYGRRLVCPSHLPFYVAFTRLLHAPDTGPARTLRNGHAHLRFTVASHFGLVCHRDSCIHAPLPVAAHRWLPRRHSAFLVHIVWTATPATRIHGCCGTRQGDFTAHACLPPLCGRRRAGRIYTRFHSHSPYARVVAFAAAHFGRHGWTEPGCLTRAPYMPGHGRLEPHLVARSRSTPDTPATTCLAATFRCTTHGNSFTKLGVLAHVYTTDGSCLATPAPAFGRLPLDASLLWAHSLRTPRAMRTLTNCCTPHTRVASPLRCVGVSSRVFAWTHQVVCGTLHTAHTTHGYVHYCTTPHRAFIPYFCCATAAILARTPALHLCIYSLRGRRDLPDFILPDDAYTTLCDMLDGYSRYWQIAHGSASRQWTNCLIAWRRILRYTPPHFHLSVHAPGVVHTHSVTHRVYPLFYARLLIQADRAAGR